MKKYNILYAKKTAKLIFGISAPISVLLFIVALFADVLEYDLLSSLLPMAIGLFLWGLSLFRILSATRLLNRQETQLKVAFDDSNAKALPHSSTIYLSDNWFIASGRLYLHKDYIRSISIKAQKTNQGNDYYCVFKCLHGTHKLHAGSSSNAKEIQRWFHATH